MDGLARIGRVMAGIGQAALLLTASAALAVALTLPPSPLAAADRWYESMLFRFFAPAQPPSDRVVIIGITEETLNQLPYRSPIDRGFLAQLLETIEAGQPAAIGVDLLLDQPTEPAKDIKLRQAIDRAAMPVILASTDAPRFSSTERRHFLKTFLSGQSLGDVELLPERRFDETIHRYLAQGDHGLPSFATALAGAAGAAVPRTSFRIRWRRAADGNAPFAVYPAHLISLLPPAWLRGKIAIVGSLLPGEDEHRTPISLFSRPTYGLEVHAHALAQILDGAVTNEWPLAGVAVIAVGVASGTALAAIADGSALIAGLLVLLVASWIGPALLFAAGGPLIFPMPLTLSFGAAASSIRFLRGGRARRDQRILSQMFARHVGTPVARELWRQRNAFLAGGRPRPQELVATVLFADVAGFTALCERMAPAPLIDWLDRYIDVMVQTIVAHDGVVLRFVGDGILAVFGAPVPRATEAEIDTDAQNAVRCALAMASAMRALNEQWRAQKMPAAGIRIGVHTGPLVAGCFGHGEKIEYCLLGDTANTGARIEALGKEHSSGPEDCVICAGASTYQRLRDQFDARAVGEVMLAGKKQPVGVYRIFEAASAIAL
jgi:adenylate cyclase